MKKPISSSPSAEPDCSTPLSTSLTTRHPWAFPNLASTPLHPAPPKLLSVKATSSQQQMEGAFCRLHLTWPTFETPLGFFHPTFSGFSSSLWLLCFFCSVCTSGTTQGFILGPFSSHCCPPVKYYQNQWLLKFIDFNEHLYEHSYNSVFLPLASPLSSKPIYSTINISMNGTECSIAVCQINKGIRGGL